MELKHLPHDHGHHTEAALSHTPATSEFQTTADVFLQLGDSSRLKIFWILCHCEECVINIAALMDMSSPAVSHHLRKLKACGLIVSRREGKEVYYKAADTKTAILLHKMVEDLMQMLCPCPNPHKKITQEPKN